MSTIARHVYALYFQQDAFVFVRRGLLRGYYALLMDRKGGLAEREHPSRWRSSTGASRFGPAPGSEDTELGVSMEPEVGHAKDGSLHVSVA